MSINQARVVRGRRRRTCNAYREAIFNKLPKIVDEEDLKALYVIARQFWRARGLQTGGDAA